MDIIRAQANCSGVYAIQHNASRRLYVGSSFNMYDRGVMHRRELRKGIHNNSYLQRAWRKYGESAFSFIILRKCSKGQIRLVEKQFISQKKTLDEKYGFNLSAETTHTQMSKAGRKRVSKKLSGNTHGRKELRTLNTPRYLRAEKILHAFISTEDTATQIAKKYKVSVALVLNIAKRKAWADIPINKKQEAHRKRRMKDLQHSSKKGSGNSRAKLTESDVKAIRARPNTPVKVLAEKYGVNSQVISHVRNRRTWKHV